MSGYENVVGGKLKLKGKALDVKAGGVKKKKKNKKRQDQISEVTENELPPVTTSGSCAESSFLRTVDMAMVVVNYLIFLH
ncbi:hypothetical protein CFP56_008565 [Quercus suber]|uniref:Uncharacterized protein n=1 Tax=Quercus suber TaxID=58331 RepID=A0AAW0L2L3_QUESU